MTLPDDATNVWIKSDNTLDNASGKLTIQYWYSLDGKQWSKLGDEQGPLTYDWSLSHFKGYRIACSITPRRIRVVMSILITMT